MKKIIFSRNITTHFPMRSLDVSVIRMVKVEGASFIPKFMKLNLKDP